MASVLRGLPDLGKLVKDMADDAERITVSLYNLQKDVDETSAVSFSHVRTKLKNEWEFLRIYFQKCHGFGEDVITLKDAVGSESDQDLLEFLDGMKTSANRILEISKKLDQSDMSAAFSGSIESGGSEVQSNNRAERASLQAFFASVGQPRHKSLKEIDIALSSLRSSIKEAYRFWNLTFQGCSSLISDKGSSLTKENAEQITYNWKGYQESTERAILSILKTGDAVLVAAEGVPTQRLIASSPSNETASGMGGGRLDSGWCLHFLILALRWLFR